MRGVGWLLPLLGAACSGGGASPVDGAAVPDALCPPPAGRMYVLRRFEMLPSGQGFDLDEDGAIDNELGKMPETLLTSVNDGLRDSILRGEFIVGALVTGWADPPIPDDADASLHVFKLFDADIPRDASNNYEGEGRFYIAEAGFDLNCQSQGEAESTVIAGGILTARFPSWGVIVTTGTGYLEFVDVRLAIDFADDYLTSTGLVGATATVCGLSALPAPGTTSGTALDVLVNDPAVSTLVHVDVDLDGDGLEQILGDGVSIMACVDGDGTVIDGADCPCHPAIRDGLSVGIAVDSVIAEVVGVL